MQSSKVVRNVRIFRYDPVKGGEGTFQSYQLTIDNPETTTILDVLLRIQKEGSEYFLPFRLPREHVRLVRHGHQWARGAGL